ncbi:MAG TPA: tRNA (N6-threonylcarbamoyladenosine(37)-N6)-methyltransferase TrmO [Polyangiaceae bacterium]|nr:tRNA (N6-threonylcarbamoyladenosine(37)-N6)-methyltransferase TrmO [Polyangiaceae bacterium]
MPVPPREFRFEPIGFIRSPFLERLEAPRQATAGLDVRARIELREGHGFEHALEGLEHWDRLWVLFVFDRNVAEGRGWRPKVLPPRSTKKEGVFATRSPHRPNPIGMSATRLERIEGLTLHVVGLDALDGTPVLDLKPYVPYADAFPDARSGWLVPDDPVEPWRVVFDEEACAALTWLRANGVDLAPRIESVLALGPQPHPYRRIRPRAGQAGAFTLACKEWRVDFAAEGRTLRVARVRSGYSARAIAEDRGLALHKAFRDAFGRARPV